MLPILFMLAASTSFAYGASAIQRRAGQTSAICTADFSWMDNSHSASPCQVVAQLDALCNGGTWNISAIDQNTMYNNPSNNPVNNTANFCTCSWASYNLISACTACQTFQSKIKLWDDYSALCSGKLSTTYFPSNYTLPTDLTIPFWAGTDPTTWPSGRFNVASAQQIAKENHADLEQAPPPASKKSTNVGAIVGGVIGGLVVIAAAIAGALYILRRHRNSASGTVPLAGMSGHMRSMSDLSTSTRAYTTLSSTAPFNPPTSPTIMTHNTSVRSVPFMSTMAASTAPYGTVSPPPINPPMATSPPPPNRVENVIEPFVTPPQQANLGHDRKQSNGSGFPVYDSPSAPPVGGMRMEITRPTTPSQGQRAGRYNPPAYSESSSGKGNRPIHRGKQASTDTLQSLTSSRNHATRPSVAHSPNSSASGMANITGQISASNNQTSGSGTSTPRNGHQVNTSRDEKRRPPEDGGISGRDIA